MTMPENFSWPYSERNGVHAAAEIKTLLAPPEFTWTDVERTALQDFGTDLFSGRLRLRTGVEFSAQRKDGELAGTLEEVTKQSATAAEQTFYLDYFKTEQGSKDLAALQIETTAPEGTISTALTDIERVKQQLSAKERKDIATRSLNWYKADIAKRLLDQKQSGGLSASITVHYAPDRLLNKVDALQAYRVFYRNVSRGLRSETGALGNAKRVLLETHQARVNDILASLYPNIVSLAMQLDRGPVNDQTEAWVDRLIDVAPVISRVMANEQNATVDGLERLFDDFHRRLDLIRNGAAWYGGVEATPLSPPLVRLVADLQDRTEPHPATAAEVPADIVQLLDNEHWNADQMKQFTEAVLGEGDLLSSEQARWDEIEERDGFAPDEKWQVVVHPKRHSFSTVPTKRVIYIPGNFDRTITEALAVEAHEQRHVQQSEEDYKRGEELPLARIKGRRASTFRELGGIDQERELQAMLGRARPTSPAYFAALQVRLTGGNHLHVARAFYEASKDKQGLTDQEDKKLRAKAADRALRLFRNGGHNSQPLDYVEQELFAEALQNVQEADRDRIFTAASSFSLTEGARLHRYGLYDLASVTPQKPARIVWEVFARQYLSKLQ